MFGWFLCVDRVDHGRYYTGYATGLDLIASRRLYSGLLFRYLCRTLVLEGAANRRVFLLATRASNGNNDLCNGHLVRTVSGVVYYLVLNSRKCGF